MKPYFKDVGRIASIIVLSFGVGVATFAFSGRMLARSCIAFLSSLVVFIGIWLVDIWLYGEPKKAVAKKNADFDWATHYFRGIAIMFIMACHFTVAFPYGKLHLIAFKSATHLFLFISGYLCQYLHERRPQPALFYYRKKIVNVISPYIIFSLLFAVVSAGFGVGSFSDLGFNWKSVCFVAHGLLYGSIQIPYWYIPFVSALFLISPWLCRLSNEKMCVLWGSAFILSIIFPSRQYPFDIAWPGTLYMYTYFTSSYLLGFVYCRYKEKLDFIFRRYWYIFAIFAIALYFWIDNPNFLNITSGHVDMLLSLQRIFLICVVLVLLGFIKNKRIVILDLFAKLSFTLFFLHCFVFWRVFFVRNKVFELLTIREATAQAYILDLGLFMITSFALLGVCMLLKKATGRCSRFLIGS